MKEYNVFELVEKLKDATPVIKEKEKKTQNTDIEQPALKNVEKPDKDDKDFAKDVSVEPVDFKKPEDKLEHPKDKDTEQKQILTDTRGKNESKLYICNACSKTFRSSKKVCEKCKSENVEELITDKKVSESVVNSYLNEERWGIWCTTTGGVTGTRSAWMKRSGKVETFDTEEEAQAAAKKYREDKSPYGSAMINYYAEKMGESKTNEISVKVGDAVEPETAVDDKAPEANKDDNIESPSKEQSYLNTEDNEKEEIEVPNEEDAAKGTRDTMSVLQKIAGDEKLAHSVRNNAAYLLDQELKKLNTKMGESKVNELTRKDVELKLVRKPETDEWVVKYYENGKYNEGKTYYTDDKQDAIDTMKSMQKRIDAKNPGYTTDEGCGVAKEIAKDLKKKGVSKKKAEASGYAIMNTKKKARESKINEFDDDKDSNLKVIAKGIEKKEFADAVAGRTPNAKVVSDSENPDKFMVVVQESKIKEDKFDKSREYFGKDNVDTFLAKFGLGPKYKPVEPKKYECPKCKDSIAYYKEIHEDTDMDEIVLYCPNCKEEFDDNKYNPNKNKRSMMIDQMYKLGYGLDEEQKMGDKKILFFKKGDDIIKVELAEE